MSIVIDPAKNFNKENMTSTDNNVIPLFSNLSAPNFVHPNSNTDAQNTTPPGFKKYGRHVTTERGIRILIDWLTSTVPDDVTIPEFAALFNIEPDQLEEMPYGMNGYKVQYRYAQDVIFLADGAEGMGKCVILSGNGCRIVEEKIKGNWLGLFQTLCAMEANFSRVDCAIDDFKGYFQIEDVRRKILSGEYVGQFRKIGQMMEFDVSYINDMTTEIIKKNQKGMPLNEEEIEFEMMQAGVYSGQTLYFGSAKSRLRFRLYDKMAQMRAKLHFAKLKHQNREEHHATEIEMTDYESIQSELDGITFWNRFEMQARGERASAFVGVIVAEQKTVADVVAGSLYNNVRFTDRNMDDLDNRSRWETTAWYKEFLGAVEKQPLTMGRPIQTLTKKQHWMEKYVSKTLATLWLANQREEKFIAKLLLVGLAGMKDEHFSLLDPDNEDAQRQRLKNKFEKNRAKWEAQELKRQAGGDEFYDDLLKMYKVTKGQHNYTPEQLEIAQSEIMLAIITDNQNLE